MSAGSEIVTDGEAHVHVEASPLAAALNKRYYDAKAHAETGLDAYAHAWAASTAGFRALTGDFNYARTFKAVRDEIEKRYTHSTEYSSRKQAREMREISERLLEELLKTGRFTREELENPPMRKRCNDKLWVLDDAQRDVDRVTSDDVVPLFDPRKPSEWPNIILTANHARASSTDDLVELLKGVEQFGGDAGKKPLDVHRLKHGVKAPPVKGKTITVLACHTERDILLNGAELLERRCALEEDVDGNANPALRTLENMSPAAMRLAKLILKSMVELPEKDNGIPLVDLDRATKEFRDAGNPYVANAHNKNVVLRLDANAIAQHFKLVGFSKGANAAACALRFLYLEFAHLGERLKIRGKDGKLHVATANEIKTLIENIGLLSLAPGDVPLTEAEKHVVGIKRSTILNTHDMTAGHLVNPDTNDYDIWSDNLVKIEGTTEELGHSIRSALGADGQVGYIMDPRNTDKPNYRTAQDVGTAFFASNHQKHAITTLCLSPEGRDNVMYVQFAPGVSRAEERKVEKHIEDALKQVGFKGAKVESDLANRRRLRVVLDHDAAKHPVITNDNETYQVAMANHTKVNACQRAFAELKKSEGADLFITHEAVDYFQKLLSIPDRIIADVRHQGESAAPIVRRPAMIAGVGPKSSSHGPARITGKRPEETLLNKGSQSGAGR